MLISHLCRRLPLRPDAPAYNAPRINHGQAQRTPWHNELLD